MNSDRITRLSAHMATLSFVFIIAILLLNAASWFFPNLSHNGISLGLTTQIMQHLQADISAFPWWQLLGGVLLSSVPLLALTIGLWHMRALFQGYQQDDYFSSKAAHHLSKVARAVVWWVVLNFLCNPLLSIWTTLRAPAGQHIVTLSFGSPEFVALYLAGCIAVIAHVLKRASAINHENQQFV